VNAQNAWVAVGAGGAHGRNGSQLLLAGITEKGGQEGGGAAAAVGGQHGVHGGFRGGVIEQQVAAAVDLQVNQARGQNAGLQ